MADTMRMKALQNLAGQIPIASQRIATGQQAARTMQLQQAVQKAPTTAPITATAQQTGAALAQQQGEQATKNVQQGAAQLGQVGELGLAEQQRQNQATTASLQSGAREQSMDQAQRLNQLDSKLKTELYDNTMKFEKDELGRTKFNELQLLDFARTNAKSDEQLRSYQQSVEQITKRQAQAMEQASKLVIEDLNQRYAAAKANKDYHTAMEIDKMRKDVEAQISKDAAKAANKNAVATTVFGTIGAVVGGVYGGPGGAAAGGQIGQGAGSAVNSQANK